VGNSTKVDEQRENESIVVRMYRFDLPDSRNFPPGRLEAHRARLLGEVQAHRRLALALGLAIVVAPVLLVVSLAGRNVSVSRGALAAGAPPSPTGSALARVIDAASADSADSQVTSLEIVPTTRAVANRVAFDSAAGQGKAGVYLVVLHGRFSCGHTCSSSLGVNFGSAPGAVKIEIVDTTYTVTDTSLSNTEPNLSALGPITRVTL
jgi:hypothetical protein